MAKYIIDIPDTDDYKIYSPLNGLELGLPWKIMDKTYTLPTLIKLEPYIESNRKTVEDEVWELARAINYMGYDDFVSCFGGKTEEVVYELSYSEVKAQYEAWKKQKDEIRIGDELKDDENIRAVVLDIMDEDYVSYEVFTENGIVDEWQNGIVVKTGRHFPEVVQLLVKMREDTDD